MSHQVKSVALAGIPNCGKTTLFNTLTGNTQRVGNWPGVTVEKVEGTFLLGGQQVRVADLPGTQNLNPDTEDQKVAERVIRGGEYDVVLNVVDACHLERSLYLTLDLKERSNQVIVLLNMIDIAEKEGLQINIEHLEKKLGLQIIPVSAIDKESVQSAVKALEKAIEALPPHSEHPSEIEVMDTVAKYAHIDELYSEAVDEKVDRRSSITSKIDRIVLNKFAAIPIFLLSMFLMFWLAIGLGSAFIDFFDIIGGLLFVDIPGTLLGSIGTPEWLLTFVGAIGAGAQTVATFVPVVFFMFFALAILEDLGYMARVSVVADRFMRLLGLPGTAFIPMITGFGCTVPAVMAARTLATRRDRFMTIFMAPFMSCGARLPVYALFCAALFKESSALMVFLIYLAGLFMAIVTGLVLKGTLFKGAPSYFVMDLPLYHAPRPIAILRYAWLRLVSFVKKAGTILVVAVCILTMLDSVGIEDKRVSFGNTTPETSLLAHAGKSMNPVLKPMGIAEDNWPASVALFTGLFAKEAIVGTLNSLYASMDAEAESAEADVEEEEGGLDIGGTIGEAFGTIKDGIAGLFASVDLLGLGLITEDADVIKEEIGADDRVYAHIAANFSKVSAFAYLLFVLMYFPCLAVIGAARKEMGGFFAGVMAVYSTLLAWSVATLFYQVAEGHNVLMMVVSVLVLGITYGGLFLLGKKERDEQQPGLKQIF